MATGTAFTIVDGRLIREPNPIPGEKPGFMPQHIQPDTTTPEITEGSDGALHAKIIDANKNSLFSQSNPGNVQLTGRNVELVTTYFSSYTPTDTSLNVATKVDKSVISKYQKLFLKVTCNLEDGSSAAITTTMKMYDNGSGMYPVESIDITRTDLSIQLFNGTDLKVLDMPGTVDLNVGVQAQAVPASGSVTVELYGLPN